MKQNIKKVKQIAKERYYKKDFDYHILPVVKNAMLLAKKLNADKEVVEVSAYLHDIGRTFKKKEDFNPENEHHITGAREARNILKKLNYSEDFIKKVEHCVLSHRGRREPNPKTTEAKIISCADAMAHFDTFLALFEIFIVTTNSFEDAIIKIEKKMDRNWDKKLSMPEAKQIVKEKYNAVKLLINSMKEHIK